MVHRTTWIALPIVALVVIGAGTSWWGYDQYRQNQAMALRLQGSYNGAFQGLSSDVEQLHDDLGQALVTNDISGYQQRLRDIARLGYAADAEVSRIPPRVMPDGHIQQFTRTLGDYAAEQATSGRLPTPAVRAQLDSYWMESGNLAKQMQNVQPDIGATADAWLTSDVSGPPNAHHAGIRRVGAFMGGRAAQRSPTTADKLRSLDASVALWMKENPKSAAQPVHSHAASRATTAQAKHAVATLIGAHAKQNWQVASSHGADILPVYIVTGSTSVGDLYATVTQRGAQVLSFHLQRSIGTKESLDGAQARQTAVHWLSSHHLGDMQVQSASQFDGTLYVRCAPHVHGVPLIDQTVTVQVALDNGQVVGFDRTSVEPTGAANIPARKMTAQQLRTKLNPGFRVREEHQVIATDAQGHPQPAVAFYGTSHGETYCILMNANTGKELRITQLTSHL